MTIPQFGDRDPDAAYTLRPGAYALIQRDGLIAVIQAPRATTFPGGGQDPGEPLEQTALRETREETGLAIEILRPLGTADQILQPTTLSGHPPLTPEQSHYICKRCHFYAAHVLSQTGTGEPDHQLLWLPPADALATLTFGADIWALRRLLDSTT